MRLVEGRWLATKYTIWASVRKMTIGQKKMPRASALAPQAVSGVRIISFIEYTK